MFRDLLLHVLKHVAAQGTVLVVIYASRRLLKERRSKVAPKACQKDETPRVDAGYRLWTDPDKQYTPDTPDWLLNGMSDHTRIKKALLECPPLTKLKADLEGKKISPGNPARMLLFQLDSHAIYVNHGSYGAAFRGCTEVQDWFRELLEEQPVRFMEQDALPAIQAVRRELAGFIRAHTEDVVPILNATAAVNLVINSLAASLGPGDLLLMTSLTYPAVKNVLMRAAARGGAGIVEVRLDLATLDGGAPAILRAFQAALGAGHVRLAVIDHVVSFPPVALDVRSLAGACRAAGALVMIDGAHAVGALDLDVPASGAHFYTSNLHKWLCTPRGAAFLWAAPSQQAALRPLITSHGCGRGFEAEMLWQGTQDPTPWLSTAAALAIFQALGPAAIRGHNHATLLEGVMAIREAWGPTRVIGADTEDACMAAIELPAHWLGTSGVRGSGKLAAQLHNQLRDKHRVEVPTFWWEDRLWIRISAQLYNCVEDYRAVAQAVLSCAP